MLETETEVLDCANGTVKLSFRGFEIKTLRITK